MHRHLFVLFLLALTQITGWGMVSILPVIATTVAKEFRTSLPMVFVGTSLMFVTIARRPLTGRAFRMFGARSVMAVGAGLIGAGLSLLALMPSLSLFWAAWVLIGMAGSMFLTPSAYAYIADYAEDRARSLIGTLMLVTGLAGSVFWPLPHFSKWSWLACNSSNLCRYHGFCRLPARSNRPAGDWNSDRACHQRKKCSQGPCLRPSRDRHRFEQLRDVWH